MQTCWALATHPAMQQTRPKPTNRSKFHVTTPEDRLRNLESTFQRLGTKSDTLALRQAINDPDLSLREEIACAGTTMAQRDLSTTRFFGAIAVVGATSIMTFLALILFHCIDAAARPAATHRLTCRIRRSAGSVRVPNPRTHSSKPARNPRPPTATDVYDCHPSRIRGPRRRPT